MAKLVAMTTKIPSALKWLLTRRARIQGEILKTQARLANRIHAEEFLIETLNADLRTVDLAIKLHQIPLDPADIPPIRTQIKGRRFAHGQITRGIFAAFRKGDNAAMSVSEITIYLMAQLDPPASPIEFLEIKESVYKRIRALGVEGKLERVSRATASIDSYWRIKNWGLPSLIGRPPKL